MTRLRRASVDNVAPHVTKCVVSDIQDGGGVWQQSRFFRCRQVAYSVLSCRAAEGGVAGVFSGSMETA